MGILAITTDTAGQINVNPRRVKIITTDNLATITTAGYLNSISLQGYIILPTDFLDIDYSFTAATNSGTLETFTASISNGVITLNQWTNPGDVLLPVVSGDFAAFNGTSGQIKDFGYLPSNAAKTNVVMANGATVANHIGCYTDTAGTIGVDPATAISAGNIQAGLATGAAGSFITYPTTTARGSLALTAVNNSGNFANVISNASTAQATTWTFADPGGAAANILQAPAALVSGNLVKSTGTVGVVADAGIAAANTMPSVIANPDPASDFIQYDVLVTAAALASAGQVIIQTGSGSKQYKVKDIRVNVGTGLSGGGGNRLLAVTDGTTVFNSTGITAALLGTPINTLWGGTGNPLPAGTASFIAETLGGANLYFQYTGGTTDYTTGNLVVSVLLLRAV